MKRRRFTPFLEREAPIAPLHRVGADQSVSCSANLGLQARQQQRPTGTIGCPPSGGAVLARQRGECETGGRDQCARRAAGEGLRQVDRVSWDTASGSAAT